MVPRCPCLCGTYHRGLGSPDRFDYKCDIYHVVVRSMPVGVSRNVHIAAPFLIPFSEHNIFVLRPKICVPASSDIQQYDEGIEGKKKAVTIAMRKYR